MATNWPRTLTEGERSAILDDQIERFVWEGWRPVTRTTTTAQLTRPKQFSGWSAILWFMLCGFGVLIYLFLYLAKKDQVVRLSVDEHGRTHGDFAGEGDWPRVVGEWACKTCEYPNGPTRGACLRCETRRPQ